MGDYVTGAEVYDLLVNQTIGPPTRIPPADVEPYIDEMEGQVNGILRARGYEPVPATDVEAKTVIRGQVRKKVAALIYTALNQDQRSPDWVRTWDIDWAEWLNRLRLGQEKLPGGAVNPLGDVLISSFNLGMTEVEEA